jgi:hypothetical protein
MTGPTFAIVSSQGTKGRLCRRGPREVDSRGFAKQQEGARAVR